MVSFLISIDREEFLTVKISYQSFPLCRTFPDRFRVIILTRKRSKAMNHFKLRKCPLLYMGDQIHFNAGEISQIIDEHASMWRPFLLPNNQESFEGRLSLIKNELVVKREKIFEEQ